MGYQHCWCIISEVAPPNTIGAVENEGTHKIPSTFSHAGFAETMAIEPPRWFLVVLTPISPTGWVHIISTYCIIERFQKNSQVVFVFGACLLPGRVGRGHADYTLETLQRLRAQQARRQAGRPA